MIDIEELKAEMEQEKKLEKDDSPTLLKELDDVATSASGAVGIVMLGTLIFDAIKNKNSESGERLFQGSLGWLLGIGGSALVGISVGRLGRGSIAQKEAESFTNMIQKIEEKILDLNTNKIIPLEKEFKDQGAPYIQGQGIK